MLPGRLLLLAAVLSCVLGQARAAEPTVSFNGWVDTDTTTVQGTVNIHAIDTTTPRPSLGYVDYLPQGYNANDHATRWPVVFALLGVGEEGDGKNTGNQLFNNMTKHGPLYDVVSHHYDFPCIIITPQAPNPSGWNNVTQLRAMVDYVKANYRVDTTRIFMTGLCDGSAGTVRFATTYPGILAGMIAITTTYSPSTTPSTNSAEMAAVDHLPTWWVHCFADSEFNRRNSVAWANQTAAADTGLASDLMATYPGYGGTNNHYSCPTNSGTGLPTSPNGPQTSVGTVTLTNGSKTIALSSGNVIANTGSFYNQLWTGTDAAPFTQIYFDHDATRYNVSSVSATTITLTQPYPGTTRTDGGHVSTPNGSTLTAYYTPSNGLWTWPTDVSHDTQTPPPAGMGFSDNRVFTMFWQYDHTSGWINTWLNGQVWDWLFTRAPNTTPATVTLSGLSTTYSGSAQVVTATTSPSGLAVNVTYNGSVMPPITANTYTVVATVNDPVYSGSATGTLVIAQAPLSITLSGTAAVYDGSPKTVSAAVTPAGTAINVTYNGSPTPPTEPGTYAVVASSADPNYTGSGSASLVIGKATAAVALGQLSFTFDNTPKPIAPSTSPSGLALTVTYNGASTAPTALGTYAVVATVSDAHYQGHANGSLVISSAAATVTLSGLTATYDGSGHGATVTTSPAGLSNSVTYDGAATLPINAGSHAVVATVTDPSFTGSASGSLIIAPAVATVTLSGLSVPYDGSAHPAIVVTSPPGLATNVTYGGSTTVPVNHGDYTVVATISDANYTGSATGTLHIALGGVTVTLSGLTPTYTGAARPAVVTTSPAGIATAVTYNGSALIPVTVGSYAVVATVTDPNYNPTVANGTLVIAPAAATIALTGASVTYDGNGHSLAATTTPPNLATTITYDGDTAPPTEAGSHAVSATLGDPNYTAATALATLVITPAVAAVSFTDLTTGFDGQAHAVTVVTTPAGLATTVTYDGSATPPSAVGSHTVVATITDPDYTGSGTATQTIATAPAQITLLGLAATYDGAPKPVTFTTNPTGLDVAITYNGSATPPVEAGSYAVAGTVNSPDFQGTVSGTLVIAPEPVVVTLSGLAATYDGSPKAAIATASPSGALMTVTYNGSAQAPTAAGSYTVVAAVTAGDFTGSSSATLVIAKAPLQVVADDGSATVGASIPALTFHLVGLQSTDDATVLIGTPVLSTAATSASPAGDYPISIGLSGVVADNYALSAQAGTLTLTASGTSGGTTGGASSGGGGGCGHGTAFAALVMFGLMLMGYARLMVARPTAPRD